MNDKVITIVLQGNPLCFPVMYTNSKGVTSGESMEFDNIATYVTAKAQGENVKQIKILGNSEYALPIIEKLNLEFSNNLEIEVISE